MAAWYLRDNSTVGVDTAASTPGSIGWSAMTGWTAGASIAPGTVRRQSAAAIICTASQTTTVVTVTGSPTGKLFVGAHLKPPTGAVCTITSLGTGTGGAGTYNVSNSQSVSSGTWNGGLVTGNQRAFVAAQSSTQSAGATEPAWVLTVKGKTTDGSVAWYECTGTPALNGDLTNTTLSSAVRSTSPGPGKIIQDNGGTHLFIQTSASGTCGSGEPSYVTTSLGSATTDGTVTWTYIGLTSGVTSWGAPFAFANDVFGTSWAAAGDSVYAGDDHVEIVSAAFYAVTPVGTSASPNLIYSIDHTLSLPVSGVKAGATISTSGATVLEIQSGGSAYWFGFTFSAGTGSSAAALDLQQSSGASWGKFDSCSLKLNNTNTASKIAIGSSGAAMLELVNTTLTFGSTSQSLQITQPGEILWRNTAGAIAGTIPTTLLNATGNGVLNIEGVDLSALGAGNTICPAGALGGNSLTLNLADCKLGSGVTIAATPGTPDGPWVDAIRCDSGGTNYVQRRYWYEGTLQEELTIIRTGGASDGTTGLSWNITTTANAKWVMPFEAFPSAIWNPFTSVNKTVTLAGIWNSASLPNNDDIWIDVVYLGDSGSPQGSFQNSTKANNLASGSPLSADSTSAWDSVAPARVNTTAYTVGEVISVSSNPGRLFWCTTAGTSLASLPAGYATAVDGGTVSDGTGGTTAVFRAGTRFLLTTTLSTPQPQLAGYLSATIKAAKATATFYIDPAIALG